jgi:hypothetical protein
MDKTTLYIGMSLFQNLEIETLKVRNIITKTRDNNIYPLNFTLYSKGDGNTYWSTGVTAGQFINLSSVTSSLISTLDGNNNEIISGVYSTLNTYSTFAQNLSTYSASRDYTDLAISLFSTANAANINAIYTPLTSTYILSTSMNRAIISSTNFSLEYSNILSTQITSSFRYTSSLFGYNLELYIYQSTSVASTFTALIAGESTIMGS